VKELDKLLEEVKSQRIILWLPAQKEPKLSIPA
jgi:hypothetical protein